MFSYNVKGASLLIFVPTIIIAIGLSFLVDNALCPSPASQSVSSNTPSIYRHLIQDVRRRLCRRTSPPDEPDEWNLLHHLGGTGPWIEKAKARFGTYEKDGKPPEGCVVDQVHMLSRHAERYPTNNAGARHLALLSRLESHRLNGSLSFLNHANWTYFTSPTSPSFEDVTTTSQYAGTLSAFRLGTQFRTRYSHLLPNTTHDHPPVNFWSCSSPRDVETALYFADGLFGRDWSSGVNRISGKPTARLHIIPEIASRGGNTLTPAASCPNYQRDPINGHDQGYLKLAEWQDVFSKSISDRLSAGNPGLGPANLSALEIYSMMELCGFELLARGSSPWCQVFSRAEWDDFEYARDVLHFYRAGPGNRYAGVMGSLWLDAVAKLVVQDSKIDPAAAAAAPAAAGGGTAGGGVFGSNPGLVTGEIYVSFVHDGDIVPVLAALGIFDEDEDDVDAEAESDVERQGRGAGPGRRRRREQGQQQSLPTTHVKRDRKWRTSDLVPMAGRLVIERLNCRTPHGWRYRDVRLFVNDGWVGWAVQGAASTKGKKRSTVFVPQLDVTRFRNIVTNKKEAFGSFSQVCGLADGAQDAIAFLHQ